MSVRAFSRDLLQSVTGFLHLVKKRGFHTLCNSHSDKAFGRNNIPGSLVGVCSTAERAGVVLPCCRGPAQPQDPAPRREGESPEPWAERPVLAKALLGVQHGNTFSLNFCSSLHSSFFFYYFLIFFCENPFL